MRGLIGRIYSEGVLGTATGGALDAAGDFAVTERGAGANFTVDVAAGHVIVEGDDETEQGNYYARSTATENVTISAAPGSGTRYDIVVAQINDPTAGGAGGGVADTMTVEVVTGTVDAGVPATPDSAVKLAEVGPITNATSSITDSIITDTRPAAVLRHRIGTDLVIAGALADGAVDATAVLADGIVTRAKTDFVDNGWTDVTAATGVGGSRPSVPASTSAPSAPSPTRRSMTSSTSPARSAGPAPRPDHRGRPCAPSPPDYRPAAEIVAAGTVNEYDPIAIGITTAGLVRVVATDDIPENSSFGTGDIPAFSVTFPTS